MTIVPMQRVTLCGLLRDKPGVLEELQALGAMHLIALRTPDPLAPDDPAMRRRAETAFRYLLNAPEQLRPYRRNTDFDFEVMIGEIMANRQLQRELSDRRDDLNALIEGLEPWGDFVLPAPRQIGGEHLWLYVLPRKEQPALDKVDLPWAIVAQQPDALFVVVISPKEPPVNLLPARRTEVGKAPLSKLREELEEVEIALEKAAMERAQLTRWRVLLGASLAAAQDQDALREASGLTLDTDGVFAVQGWIASEKEPALEDFAARHRLAVLHEAPAASDMPPTLLRPNSKWGVIGSDLTNFYATPGYRSWDPSFLVFTSFAVFFAMILADAGYAALIGIGTLFYWRRMGRSAVGRRARLLLAGLVGTSLVYGVLAGSYFGVAPHEGTFLARLDVIDVDNFQKMMRLSVLVGCLHIALALGTVAWLNRGTGRMLSSLGWIGVIVASLFIWLEADSEAARNGGFIAIGASLFAVFLGGASARPITRPLDHVLRISDGLLGMTSVTKLFGDVLSYLRLFALGLASASLAATFNKLAIGLQMGRPGLGVLFSILLLIFGHSINILIGIMSGVVHGLRLNYVEFFGWGLTEEGYPFRAFAKRETSA
jgi:V/A-type H+-transporting ATPase subunit I